MSDKNMLDYIKEEMPEKYRQLELADQVLDAAISYRRVKLLKREEMNKGLSFTPEGQEMLVRLMDGESRALWQLETLIDELLAVGYEPTKVERPSFIPMAHENETATELMIHQANETLEFPPPMDGQDSWGIHDRNGNHIATIPCEGSIKSSITGEWEQRVSPLNWTCSNHPPGSEVEVKKGENCFCGRGEE